VLFQVLQCYNTSVLEEGAASSSPPPAHRPLLLSHHSTPHRHAVTYVLTRKQLLATPRPFSCLGLTVLSHSSRPSPSFPFLCSPPPPWARWSNSPLPLHRFQIHLAIMSAIVLSPSWSHPHHSALSQLLVHRLLLWSRPRRRHECPTVARPPWLISTSSISCFLLLGSPWCPSSLWFLQRGTRCTRRNLCHQSSPLEPLFTMPTPLHHVSLSISRCFEARVSSWVC
jgi:hypothetical protein